MDIKNQKTEEILLGLLGRAVCEKGYTFDPSETDWEALRKEAMLQTVEMLIYDALTEQERSAMPPALDRSWRLSIYRRMGMHDALLEEQRRVLGILEENGIACAVLKGTSSAMYYPRPELRIMGDIDLLVSPAQLEQARALMERHGYADCQGTADSIHYNLKSAERGITLELHQEPNGIRKSEKMQSLLYAYFNDALPSRQFHDGIPVLADHHQAMVLLLHMLGHFMDGELGLRQFCDWAVFVRARMQLVWDELRPILKKAGLLHVTQALTLACVEAGLLPAESAPWAMKADGQLARNILAEIIKSGNFGRKTSRYGQRLFTDRHTPNRAASFLRVGIQACYSHWPICQKYPLLLPIAPFVLVIRYWKQRKSGERPQFHPIRQFREAGPKQKLFRALQLFQEEDGSGE